MLDPMTLLKEQSHTLGRIEANLEQGRRTHDWLIERSLKQGDTLIRHGEAIQQMRRELRSKNESGFITISVWEVLGIIKEAWPWMMLLGAAMAKVVILVLPWLHSITAR
jgi:hypothetical protein